MRGVVSAGMAAALERLGLTASFDLVVGSSAGAINGGALIAGVAARLRRGLPRPVRLALVRQSGAGAVGAAGHRRGLRAGLRLATTSTPGATSAPWTSPIALHCVAVDVATAAAVDLSGMRSKRELWDAVLASSRMPWAGAPPVEFGGRRYVDGGLASPIPVAEALAAGATHVLALQTRPYGVPRKSASRLADRFIERHLRGLNPALVTLYRERVAYYEQTVDDIARRSLDAGAGPAARARPAAAGRDAGGRPARAPLGDPGAGRGRRRAPGRAGAGLTGAQRPRSLGSRCGRAQAELRWRALRPRDGASLAPRDTSPRGVGAHERASFTTDRAGRPRAWNHARRTPSFRRGRCARSPSASCPSCWASTSSPTSIG